jgi:uncharacterized protein (UPF0332 family)
MTQAVMDKAAKALASAWVLLDAGDSDGATNRAYYAMFDAAIAAIAWAGIGTAQEHHKTHGGVIGSFGMHLVQTGRLPAELGRSLNRVHELRLTGDYLAEPVLLEKARRAVQEADTFAAAVLQLLSRPKS